MLTQFKGNREGEIVLMEEILHRSRCIKPYGLYDDPTDRNIELARFLINSMSKGCTIDKICP